jgi:hypothetical protein
MYSTNTTFEEHMTSGFRRLDEAIRYPLIVTSLSLTLRQMRHVASLAATRSPTVDSVHTLARHVDRPNTALADVSPSHQ